MRYFLMFLTLFVFFALGFVSRSYDSIGNTEESTPKVLSATPKTKPYQEEELETTATPTIEKKPKPSPAKVVTPRSDTTDFFSRFQYPNSKILLKRSNYIKLTSVDSAEKITEWYKNLLKENMSVTSFVVTQVNEKILNKLSGSSGTEEITVSVSKDKTSPMAEVIVEQKNVK